MSKRGRPRNFDRAAVLQRAMEVFWAQGFDGTSMSDLIAAMNINSPSIYAAFGCKEQLFKEAIALYSAKEGGRIWEAMKSAPSAREAVAEMLRVSAEEFTRPNKPQGCFITLGALHIDESHPELRQQLQEQRAECMTMLYLRLKKAVDEEKLPAALDWRAIARFYITVQQGMSIQARDGASRKTLLAIADCAITAWEALIAPLRDDK